MVPDHDPVEVSAQANSDDHDGVLSAISREMVRIYKQDFGRGPTKASSRFAGSDILVCTLEDSFTPAERRMVELGEHQRLRDVRLFFQHSSEESRSALTSLQALG
jgi:uncharacterized protein YbcI